MESFESFIQSHLISADPVSLSNSALKFDLGYVRKSEIFVILLCLLSAAVLLIFSWRLLIAKDVYFKPVAVSIFFIFGVGSLFFAYRSYTLHKFFSDHPFKPGFASDKGIYFSLEMLAILIDTDDTAWIRSNYSSLSQKGSFMFIPREEISKITETSNTAGAEIIFSLSSGRKFRFPGSFQNQALLKLAKTEWKVIVD